MASAWQTLEEAALTLGISSRTLHRRISRGEVQTRLQNGRREVLVEISDPDPSPYVEAVMTDSAPDIMEGSAEPSNHASAVSDTSDGVRQTMLALQEDRIRRTDLAILAYQQSINVAAAEARRGRIQGRIAWSLLGTATIGMFLAVVWFTHNLTEAQAKVGQLTDAVEGLSVRTETLTKETDALRQSAEEAKLAAARAEGELSATKRALEEQRRQQQLLASQRQKASAQHVATPIAPTTRPVIRFDRLADLFSAAEGQ